MKLIYRIGIFLARLILPLLGLLFPRIGNFLEGRKDLFKKLEEFKKNNPGSLAWFHVASLGEYEQAKPVIAVLKKTKPGMQVVVSFFSPSGYVPASKKTQTHVDFITYLPLDGKSNADKFVKILSPEIVFFVKYDLWFHHLKAVKAADIPLYLISASFRPDQVYFKGIPFFRNQLFLFDRIFTQNPESVELLRRVGYNQAVLAGDTRFDRVVETAQNPKSFPQIESWIDGTPVWVAGSVWEEDMELLIPLIDLNPEYKWIIAPHSIDVGTISIWQSRIKRKSIRFSQWEQDADFELLFIDNIGMLSSLYQFARLSYVGGAFGRGLHNILEPIGFGSPVVFGKLKNESRFPEAAQSQIKGCGFEVRNFVDLKAIFHRLQAKDFYEKCKKAARDWVASNQGAAEKIIAQIGFKEDHEIGHMDNELQ